MRRWVCLLAAAGGLLRTDGAAQAIVARAPTGTVSGRVTILEKNNKPSSDLGDAVVWLDGGPAAPPAAGKFEVAISDKTFVPSVAVVTVGSTVSFQNHDPFDHNAFSVSDRNQFDLGLYGRGESKSRVFSVPGLVRVFCNVHPRMVAYIQVMGTRLFAQPGGDGSFSISHVPPGHYTLHAWHERSPSVSRDLVVPLQGVADLQIQLDARGFHWVPHKNKFGKDYPTNAGRERY